MVVHTVNLNGEADCCTLQHRSLHVYCEGYTEKVDSDTMDTEVELLVERCLCKNSRPYFVRLLYYSAGWGTC